MPKMKRTHNMFSMVQAITVLTILKMLANAQTQCNGGTGRIVYERLPDQQLQGFDDEVVRDTAPPFRVLEKCQDLCLRDRIGSNNSPRTCTSFDFQPGSRIASFSGTAEYEESTCYLTREQSLPEGIGNLMLVPNSVHFVEVCLTSDRIDRDCPNRRYVFERHPRKKLKLTVTDVKEVTAANRTACEDRCLNEFSFVCRSATYDAAMRSCLLSRFTRRTHPELLEDDANSDYLENTCLNAESRCDGLAVFVKEENKRLRGPFEVDIYTNLTLDECQALCLRAEKYFCRSVEYDEQTKQCVISEEDSVSQKDDIGISSSLSYHFYDLVCLDNPRGSEYPDNGLSAHLYPAGRRPDTAFQRYRNSRLSGEFHSEITGRSLSECLDECLRQTSFQCRSAVYSEHYHTCRLSRFNQRDGHRIIYDADYDYYENLMHQYLGGERDNPGYRPDPVGQDSNYGRPSFGRPGHPDDYDKSYIGSHGNYYPDHYPSHADRYPISKYPVQYPQDDRYLDRYPGVDRYPLIGDKYPALADRYPVTDDRYPTSADRYPVPADRYPVTGDYHPIPGERYPVRGVRYPVHGDDYPAVGKPGNHGYFSTSNRYPPGPGSLYPEIADRYPVRDESHSSPGGRYPSHQDPSNKYPSAVISGGGAGVRFSSVRNPIIDRFPEKDAYLNRDRFPNAAGNGLYPGGYEDDVRGTKGYGFGGAASSPVRPMGYGGFDTANGMTGFMGQDDPYNSRPIVATGGGPIIGRPPLLSRCDEQENFRQVGQRTRVRKPFVRRYTTANILAECERECADTRDFVCRSFNFRPYSAPYGTERDNCELSDRDSRDMAMGNPIYYDTGSDYDFYERNNGRQGVDGECLDVSQVCSEDGMEFTLRTPEGFIGRIYTYGYYERCFFRGNGGTVNVLRISGAQGYPECGTQRYGDTMTNIVVVQFSDFVQTGRDKRFNLTCLFRGPGEAVVTSGYIGAGRSGSPIPIEYLPAENTLGSKIRLMILYQGRPTTTIAVGDPLTFRLESQDGYNYVNDIFATNVIARDPYSGRSVQLIDRYGCPVDNYVFPGLDRLRDGDSLEARFNAFKIPESNFLVFEATVRSCRDGCQPAYCSGSAGRSEPSFGKRRRRSLDNTSVISSNLTSIRNDTEAIENENVEEREREGVEEEKEEKEREEQQEQRKEERVREMFEVLDSRYDMYGDENVQKQVTLRETICIPKNEYYGLLTAVIGLVILLSSIILLSILVYRKYEYSIIWKNRSVDKIRNHRTNDNSGNTTVNNSSFMRSGLQKPFQTSSLSRIFNHQSSSTAIEGAVGLTANGRNAFDPSEPIYTDPSLFEVSCGSLHQSKSARNGHIHLI